MSVELVDIGANLTHDAFREDRDAVIARARANGVSVMVVTGASEEGSVRAMELARAWPGVLFATAGVHPHHAEDVTPDTLAALGACARAPETVAVGEAGLDFFRDFSPRPVQEQVFEAQLELAAEVGKPAFLHLRDAHDRFVAILKPYRDRLARVVVHCFTGTREELHELLDLDVYIGVTGWICDERRGRHLRDIVSDVPSTRLMIETDAPYLLPRDLPADFDPRPVGRRNEPALLPHVLAAVAEARGQPPAVVATATTSTARAFFALP